MPMALKQRVLKQEPVRKRSGNPPLKRIISVGEDVNRFRVDNPDFDDALACLQRLLGVENGDLAGAVFSDPEPWNRADTSGRWSILLDYIAQETRMAAPDSDA